MGLKIFYAIVIAGPCLYYGLGLLKCCWSSLDSDSFDSFIVGICVELFLVVLSFAIMASGAFGIWEVFN